MNCKALLVSCLLLVGCGSSDLETPRVIHILAVNVDYDFAQQVSDGVQAKFDEAGIPVVFTMSGVMWPKSYAFGEKEKALRELTKVYGNAHYLLPKFGNYFDGYQSGEASLSVAVVGRLTDSVEQAAHEIAHQLGASHDFSNCNIMSYRRCGYPAKFNEKAVEEMR